MPKRVRRFSQGSPIVSSYIRDLVSKDVRYKDNDERKLPYLARLSGYSLVIPTDGAVTIDQKLEDDPFLTDRRVKCALEETRLINWCPGIKRFIPLSVTNDGNTLCHSTSVALWGIHDRQLILRRLINSALKSDQREEIKKRWLPVWKNTCGDDSQNAEAEWNIQLEIANETNRSARQKCPIYDPLEDLHIFVLANVIRRPIIVFADRPVRSTNEESEIFPGLATLYLPLLWPASQCVRSPVVLGYCDNYFAPLVTLGGEVNDFCPEVVPMVRENQTPIELRYLSDQEKQNQSKLMKDYLTLADIEACNSNTYVLPTAKITLMTLDETHNLLSQFLAARSRDLLNAQSLIPIEQPRKPTRRTSRFRCGIKTCSQYITNESMFPYCVSCYEERNKPQQPVRRKNTSGNLTLAPQSIEVECAMKGCPYYAAVHCFPYCQRCQELRIEAETKGNAIPNTLTPKEPSLEDSWKKLAMGVIDEEIVVGFGIPHTDAQNQDFLKMLGDLDVKDTVYNNQTKSEDANAEISYQSTHVLETSSNRKSSAVTGARSTTNSNVPKETNEWKRKISWVNEPCSNTGCTYFASIHTYPFCNQCGEMAKSPTKNVAVSRKVSGTARTLPTLVQED